MKNIKQNRKLILIILLTVVLMLVIVFIVGRSFGFFKYAKEGDKVNVVAIKGINVEIINPESAALSLENAYPVADSEGLTYTPFTFTMTNTSSRDLNYTLLVENDLEKQESCVLTDNTICPVLSTDYIRYSYLMDDGIYSEPETLGETGNVITNGIMKANETVTVSIILWVSSEAGNEIMNNYFYGKLLVRGDLSTSTAYQETLLNGADPVLTDNLVPVTIADDGTVTKADINKEWYSYGKKEWANAVVLREAEIVDTSSKNNIATKIGNPNTTNDGITFDGVEDALDVGYANYDFSNGITMAINFKMNELEDDKTLALFGNWDSSGGGILIHDKELRMNLRFNEYSGYYKILSGIKLEIDTYYSVVATYNGEIMKLYLDGNLIGTYSVDATIMVSKVPMIISANPTSSSSLAEVSASNITSAILYDRAVTEEEVAEYYETENITNQDNILFNYQFGNNYKNNDVIPEDDIESYFVWIPKYSYQLWDLGNYSSLTTIDNTKPHAIPIKFGITNTDDANTGECTTPISEDGTQGLAGESGNCSVGDYMTHPAFLAFNTNGLWVGKFETGYDRATTTSEAQIDSSDSSKIVIKPNVYSWRSVTVGNAFKASYDYLREDQSHMMKNTEWGAVAYLSHSNYGINEEVRINNNSSFVTGYSATIMDDIGVSVVPGLDADTSINYLNSLSILSSTTKNKTGVYDTSGGAWEYVMGYTTNATTIGGSSNINNLYNDFFETSDNNKYYDNYTSTVSKNYNNRILGDATGEMGPFVLNNNDYYSSWYGDIAYFINSTNNWFMRGRYYSGGSGAGIFSFLHQSGSINISITFRVVLAP